MSVTTNQEGVNVETTFPTGKSDIPAVYHLPPEILLKIFESYQDLCPEPEWQRLGYEFKTITRWLAWIRVTFVSRQWRETALACPSLWSRIIVDYGPWSEEMYRRSKTALLDAVIPPPPTPAAEKFASTLLSDLSRFRRLHFLEPFGRFHKTIIHLVNTTPAPNLEAVAFSCLSRPITLPAHIFSDHAPNLRSITLDHGDLTSWSSLIPFKALTKLRVDFTYQMGRRTPDVFLDALAEMPVLSELHIAIRLQDIKRSWEERRQRVHLRHLRRLALRTDTLEELEMVLRHIAVPGTTLLHLHCWHQNAITDASFKDLVSTLSSNCWAGPLETSPSPPSFQTLAFSVDVGFTVSGWFEAVDVIDPGVKMDDVPFRLGGISQEATSQLLRNLPISGVRRVFSDDGLPDDRLALFNSLPSLEWVTIGMYSASPALHALSLPHNFPALKVLTLSNVRLVPFPQPQATSSGIHVGHLIGTLGSRIRLDSAAKGGIEQVRFLRCSGLTSDAMIQVKSSLPLSVQIYWDVMV